MNNNEDAVYSDPNETIDRKKRIEEIVIEDLKESNTRRIEILWERIHDSNELINSGTLSDQKLKEEIEFRDNNIKLLNLTKKYLDALNAGKSPEEANKIFGEYDKYIKPMKVKPTLA